MEDYLFQLEVAYPLVEVEGVHQNFLIQLELVDLLVEVVEGVVHQSYQFELELVYLLDRRCTDRTFFYRSRDQKSS